VGDDRKLNLNIGGRKVDVRRSVLVSCFTENLFLALITNVDFLHLFPKTKDGRIFFDIDEQFIGPILKLCSDFTLWDGNDATKPLECLPPLHIQSGMTAFYQHLKLLHSQAISNPSKMFHDSAILNLFGKGAISGLV